jgi:hypothetical protein
MTDSEKWAWWTLGVVALTAAAYATFVALLGHWDAAQSVFALIALTALPKSSRRYFKGRRLDQREIYIANAALLAGFRALWVAFIGFVVPFGFIKGWDTSVNVPMWVFSSSVWWATMLLLTVQATTTLVLYRRGAHA